MAAALQVQQQASELQQAVQRPLGALGQGIGQVGSGLQRSLDSILDRGTAPTRQVTPYCTWGPAVGRGIVTCMS